MALTRKSEPTTYPTLNAPVIFVYSSTNSATTNFKYIYDVYIAGTMVARYKIFPDVDYEYGVCDISAILREYANTNYLIIDDLSGSDFLSQPLTSGTIYVPYELKIGEEISGTINANLDTFSGNVYNTAYNYDFFLNRDILSNYADKGLIGSYSRKVSLEQKVSLFTYLQHTLDDLDIRIKTYNSSGTLVKTFNSGAYGSDSAIKGAVFNVSPVELNRVYDSIYHAQKLIDSDTHYYTVEVRTTTTPTTTQIITYYLDCNPNWERYSLHYVNGLGGFETKDFKNASKKSIDIDRKKYSKLGYKLNAGGTADFYTYNDAYQWRENVVNYANTIKQTIKLTADFDTEEEYEWLAQLFYSPCIYIEMQNGDDTHFFPCQIKANNYEYIQPKISLKPLEIEVELSTIGNSQLR